MKTPADASSAAPGSSGVSAMMRWALEGRANEPTEILDEEERQAAASVPAAGREGRVIGTFTLVKLLGQGGFGEVWQAEQSGHIRRTIALKLIKPGMASADVMRRFETERQALAVMDHPNIARVLDAGATPQGGPWFAMELVNGCAITTYCDEQRLPVAERLRLFLQVCGAVQHAHQKGVLHRDLKPSNILVAEDADGPVPKVIDFGIAKAVGSSPELMMQDTIVRTTKGVLIGTPEYMSPEQAGSTPDLDTRSDIYMLGVLLFELLTGSTPLGRRQLSGIPFLEMLRRIREVDPPRPSACVMADAKVARLIANDRDTEPLKLSRQLRGDLDSIVLMALDKDRDRRYATASDLADDITRHLKLETVTASPPSNFYRFGRMIRRNKVAAAAIAVALLSLVSGLGISLWMAGEARRERDRAVTAEQGAETRRRESDEARKLAEEAEEHAADAAASAQAVKQFLHEDLLQNGALRSLADRTQVLRPELTILELLDNGSKRLAERFEAQTDPLLEAEMWTTIGVTYVNISMPKPAVPHLRRALELREKKLGGSDPLTIESLRFLAATLSDAGESKEAIELAELLVQRCKTASPPDDIMVVEAKETLALALRAGKKLPEAIQCYEEVLEFKSARFGRTTPETMMTINNLAAALMDSSQLEKARSLLESAGATWSSGTDGKESAVMLRTMMNLATVYRQLGQDEDALRISRRAYEGLRRTLGENHLDTLRAGEGYSHALIATGKSADALRVLESARFYAGRMLAADDPLRRGIETKYDLVERAAKPAVAFAPLLEGPETTKNAVTMSSSVPSQSSAPTDAGSIESKGTSGDRPAGAPASAPRTGAPQGAPASLKLDPRVKTNGVKLQPDSKLPPPTKPPVPPPPISKSSDGASSAVDIRPPLRAGGSLSGPPGGRSVIPGRGGLGGFRFVWKNGSWTSSSPVRTNFSSDSERQRDVAHWVRLSGFPSSVAVSFTTDGRIIVTPKN